MSDEHSRLMGTGGKFRDSVDRRLADDLGSLRSRNGRDLPSIHDTARAARERSAGGIPGGNIMSLLRGMKARPWRTTAAAAAVVAAAMLIIPVSYERTVGHEVALKLASPSLDGDMIRKISAEVMAAFDAEGIRVSETAPVNEGRLEIARCTLLADVPSRSTERVEALAAALARSLEARGIGADAVVSPKVERTSGSVYAFAGDVIDIVINTEGKSAEDIEQEMRDRLEEAGIYDHEVDVELDGDEMKVRIKVEREGEEGDEDGAEVRFRFEPVPEDAEQEAKRIEIKIRRTPDMTDEDVLADVRRQLEEQGYFGAEVTMENGSVKIVHPDIDDDM
jgi:hypothetical protein